MGRKSKYQTDMLSSSNVAFQAGTHRTGQVKESNRTPGPGTYRTCSTFPLSARSCVEGDRQLLRRSSKWPITARATGRAAELCPLHLVVPAQARLARYCGTDGQATMGLGADTGEDYSRPRTFI